MNRIRVKSYTGERGSIKFLYEVPTKRRDMIEFIEGELIIYPEYQKKYKTKAEVNAYNNGIKTAINIICACNTTLEDRF